MRLRDVLDIPIYVSDDSAACTCLNALDTFLSLGDCELSRLAEIDVWTAIKWGAPLALINPAFYEHEYIEKFRLPFSNNTTLDEDQFTELEALALLLITQPETLTPVSRQSKRTHDFDVVWGGASIEVEVTRPAKKEVHVALQVLAQRLCALLHNSAATFDVVVQIARLLNEEEIESLVSAAKSLNCGENSELPGVWHVAAKLIDRPVHVILRGGEVEDTPDWWPTGRIAMFNITASVAGPDTVVALPRTKVCYMVPFDGYLNSAKKKAKRFQGSLGRPFLLVVDVTALPRAFEVYEKGPAASFGRWKHVSGVLAYERFRTTGEVGWTMQLFNNPFAARPLPEQVVSNLSINGGGVRRTIKGAGSPPAHP